MASRNLHEIFARVVLLMMTSPVHHRWSLGDVNRLIVTPLLLNQYFLTEDPEGNLIAFTSYARLTDFAAEGYVSGKRKLEPDDWDAGDQLWFIDFVAPYGGVGRIVRSIKDRFPDDRVAYVKRLRDGKFHRVGVFERKLVG